MNHKRNGWLLWRASPCSKQNPLNTDVFHSYIIDAENFVRIPETESTTWDTPGLPGDVGSGDYHYYEWGLCDDELLDRIRSFRRSDSPPNV